MAKQGDSSRTGIIAWFASNPVAANLMMLVIIAFGIASTFTIRKQTTPDFELRNITVRVPYLGAAPQEVEEGVVIKIEEAIQDIQGIVELNSRAVEGTGTVIAEVASGEDLDLILNEIKTRVDAISTFPALTERPIIEKQEIDIPVILISLYGNLDEYAQKSLAQEIQDELVALPQVNQVAYLGEPDYEISIEVSEHVLRQYGLTMSEVSQAIRDSAVDLPGGRIQTSGGDILLRTEGQVYTGLEFADIVLRSYPDGTRLLLGDIAAIDDGFVERRGFGRFNGKPSAVLRVLAGAQENELATAAMVRDYVERKAATLPPGVELDYWIDRSYYLQDRLDMMLENMLQGALLVVFVLALFLRFKVAIWVLVGIPVAFFGALWLMPHGPWPVTINLLSLFGMILVLGIVVDDAIVIGESIYTKIRADGHSLDNVVAGAQRVATPATFGVLTTIAAFAPMLFVGGFAGPFFESLSVVVILCLLFSLVESKLILPAHLSHTRIAPVDEAEIFRPLSEVSKWKWPSRFFQRLNRYTQHGLHAFVNRIYEPLLRKALDARGVTVALFTAVLIITFGVLGSGYLRVVLFPDIPNDFIQVSLTMEDGTPPAARDAALERIEAAALAISDEWVRDNPDEPAPIQHIAVFTNGVTGGQAFVELPKGENRSFDGEDIEMLWRERVGEIPGVRELSFSDGNNVGGGPPLSFALVGNDFDLLQGASAELESRLASYEGVFDIRNSISMGGEEIRLAIKPEAEALGLTMSALGRQVRQAFYGEEAQRIQRGRDELKVMVRYPAGQRRSVADLENMRIRTASGAEVPFEEVADVEFGRAFSTIHRQNRERVVTVSADLDPMQVQPGEVRTELAEEFIPELLSRYPGVEYRLEGASLEEQEFFYRLTVASIASMFLIYMLIAIPLKSYQQPLIIMSVIPFGLIGAAVGHLVLGMAISMFSLFGIIALAGVVVNDSIILVDFVNKARAEGMRAREAVVQAGVQRFRAIVLTSLTTAMGLVPIMLERSLQAQFVIPMAVSLAFGIVFATVITLFLVPSLYLMQLSGAERLRNLWRLAWSRDEQPAASA